MIACIASLILNFLDHMLFASALLVASIWFKISSSIVSCACCFPKISFSFTTFFPICGFNILSSLFSDEVVVSSSVCSVVGISVGFVVGCSTGLVVGVSVGFVVGRSVGFIVGLGVCFFLTVILHLYFFLPTLAVIVTFPAFLPFTFPFLLTVAIFLLEVVHLTFFLLFFNFNVTVFPT